MNIIGISIEPIIRIGNKDESDYIEVAGKTIVPIQNESNFDIPVCIEIGTVNDKVGIYHLHQRV